MCQSPHSIHLGRYIQVWVDGMALPGPRLGLTTFLFSCLQTEITAVYVTSSQLEGCFSGSSVKRDLGWSVTFSFWTQW